MKISINAAWEHVRLGVRRRTILLSLVVGALSGVATFAFFLGLEYVTAWCTRGLMGVSLPHPRGEHFAAAYTPGDVMPWLILLLPAAGALLSSLIMFKFAPDAAGDGMDATIKAFHEQEGRVPARIPFIKAIGSILTIGSGGSAGREGPVAQICSGIGSGLASLFRLNTREHRTFMLAGTAAGIGAMFRAPLGGAVSAIEILYKEDFESSSMIPCVLSSVTAYTTFTALLALPFVNIDAFTLFTFPRITSRLGHDIGFYIVLGLICAAVGRLYVWCYRSSRGRIFAKLPLPAPLKACLGGLCVGAIALFAIKTLGTGMGLVQEAVDMGGANLTPEQFGLLMRTFLMLALLKIVTTSLTLGSGGSGGVFGPTLAIGGLVGAATGMGFHAFLPDFEPPAVAAFVALGMAGFFAGVANASIGAVIMVTEMTGSYTLLAPLLIVCVITVLLGRGKSLYEHQVESRFQSPAYRRMLMTDLLSEVTVNMFYHRIDMPTIRENATAAELRKLLADADIPFPLTVVDDHGKPTGILTMGNIRPVYFEDAQQQLFLVRDMATPLVTCSPDDTLASVLRKYESFGYSRIPVVSARHTSDLLGYIQYQDVMIAYETEIARRRLNS